jgi:molybdopterin-guanine dinucleotide biosynthesis protein A
MMAVVLVGGGSTRIGFLDKCLYSLHGKSLVLHVVRVLQKSRLFEDIYLFASTRNANASLEQGFKVLTDVISGGPLIAIHQLIRMFGEVCVVACDMPYITVENVSRLVKACAESFYACVPRWRSTGYVEPLYAIYRRNLLSVFEKCFAEGELSISRCLSRYGNDKVLYIPVEEVFRDPWREFMNVNSYEELVQALEHIRYYIF